MQIDVRVLELMASKLCHDLISPVSAINNGVELIEDIGGSVVDEAMKLIGDSAGQAARRLKLFRVAYGRAGSEEGVGKREVRQIADQSLSAGKAVLSWPEDLVLDALVDKRGFLKVLLNILILSEEILAYGGRIELGVQSDGVAQCSVTVSGRAAQLTPQIEDALMRRTAVEDLTPRSIQAYVTGMFAQFFGIAINYDQSVPDKVGFTLSVLVANDPS